MTRLTLLRHAKSTWDYDGQIDIERTLNERGRRDAALMGLVCEERLPTPDLVLVSPAQRARETIELFIEAWRSSNPEIMVVDALYLAGLDDWIRVLTGKVSEQNHVLICSHQPGLGDFCSWLCREFDGEIPSATVISILLKPGNLERESGVLNFTGRAKEFRN